MPLSAAVLRAAALLFAAALLTGCASDDLSTTFEMPPNTEASVEVMGASPFVEIRNFGPGEIDVAFDLREDDLWDEESRLGVGSVGRTLRNGGWVRLRAAQDEAALVSVEVRDYDGAVVQGATTPSE